MNDQTKYIRKVQTSVTCFLYHGDDYLFIHRNKSKRIDANRLNGIGGRLEPGENYLEAAVREITEETGYVVANEDIQLSGLVKLEGGYDEDWVMGFFKVRVNSKKIPHGTHVEDGELMWIHKDKVLHTSYELVDDLYYCFDDIVNGSTTFFLTVKLNEKQKVYDHSVSHLKR